jgi:hypothetical protein
MGGSETKTRILNERVNLSYDRLNIKDIDRVGWFNKFRLSRMLFQPSLTLRY